ncbi:PXA domain-containing protein [Histoplasma ohiense]|nr:PXA domain-containing protein [Histoplasma ohiense (nom. inval.)]
MSTGNNGGRPRPPQAVASKSGPIASSAKQPTLAVPSSKPPSTPRSPSQTLQAGKPSAPSSQTDAANDKATAALIRRILCPQSSNYGPDQRERSTPRPLEELLPPLTSSNEVDLQLYALIAIIIKEFVYAWYSTITPDHTFSDEIIQIIAHCTRALEQRLRQVDVDALVLDEIPALVEAHIVAFRTAYQNPHMNRSASYLHTVYHTLNPHPALYPVPDASDTTAIAEQQKRETAYRQLLAQGVLAVLLPTEDLENVYLRTLIGDILADMVLGEFVSDKLSDSPFIYELLTRLITVIQQDGRKNEQAEHIQKGRLERFGLLGPKGESGYDDSSGANQSNLSKLLWRILQYCYLTFVTIRFVLVGLFQVASSSLRVSSGRPPPACSQSTPVNLACEPQAWPNGGSLRRPVLKYRIFGMVSQLIDVPGRMPWLGGALALAQYVMVEGPGKLGDTGMIVDRFLHETIQKGLFTPTFLPVLLLAIRTTLFPFNTKPSQNATISTISSSTCSTVPQAEAGISNSASNSKIGSTLSLASSLSSKLLPVSLQARSEALSNAGENLSRRECAVSILSLIPRSVALMIFCIPTAQARNRGTTILNLKSRGIIDTNSNSGSRTTQDVTGYEVPKSSSISQQYSSHGPCKPDTNFHAFQAVHSALEPSDPSTTTNFDSTVANRKAKDSAGDSRVQTPVFSSFDDEVNTTGDDEETEEINEQEALLSAIENDILDVFADKYCNKHLMYSIIETVLVKLLPEISEHGIAELMAERGV